MKLRDYFFLITVLALGFMPLGIAVHAQSNSGIVQNAWGTLQQTAGTNGAGYGQAMDPRLIVANIVKIALGLVATVLFILNIYAGWQWMTAGGNEEKISHSRKTILDSTIGLAIILSAYALTILVTNLALQRDLGSGANTGTTIDSAIQNGKWW